MLDSLAMEQKGIPAVCIGIEKLVMTTGKGMARALGVPDYPIAVLSHDMGVLANIKSEDEIEALAQAAAAQVEAYLTEDEN